MQGYQGTRIMGAERDMQGYINEVEAASAQRFGVGFHSIAADIFGREAIIPVLRKSFASGLEPSDFVETMGRDYGLVAEDSARNRYQAALVAFLRSYHGWEIGQDGAILFQREDGVVSLSVDRRGSEMVFVTAIAEGVEMDIEGNLPEGTSFTEVATGFDLGKALDAFVREFKPGQSGPAYA